jgi:ASC-1-like (ASCH) protein
METKQTAVEWLVMQLEGEESLVARIVGLKEYNQIVKQAKQMEKEHMLKFWKGGQDSMEEGGKSFEQYYEETKQQDNGK